MIKLPVASSALRVCWCLFSKSFGAKCKSYVCLGSVGLLINSSYSLITSPHQHSVSSDKSIAFPPLGRSSKGGFKGQVKNITASRGLGGNHLPLQRALEVRSVKAQTFNLKAQFQFHPFALSIGPSPAFCTSVWNVWNFNLCSFWKQVSCDIQCCSMMQNGKKIWSCMNHCDRCVLRISLWRYHPKNLQMVGITGS